MTIGDLIVKMMEIVNDSDNDINIDSEVYVAFGDGDGIPFKFDHNSFCLFLVAEED